MSRDAQRKCVMIVAGEASGDLHGARLVKTLHEMDSDLFFCGIGADAMQRAGVRILQHASKMAVVGITEVFAKIPVLFKSMTTAKRALKSLRPDLLILIDFPDFNIHLAGCAKKLGIPVLYYISPQIWAWRSGRVKKIRRRVDHMAVILPFEEAFYRNSGVPVTFVGHPLMDGVQPEAFPPAELMPGQAPSVGLVPGSRDREVARHLPVMAEAAQNLSMQNNAIQFLVSCAPTVDPQLIKKILEGYPAARQWEILTGGIHQVLKRSHVIIAASGTVTLEAAIHGTPTMIMYKTSPLSYWMGRALIRVKHIGLVNLIAGKDISPEFIQGEATADNIAEHLAAMLENPDHLNQIRQALLGVRQTLGKAGASENVARIALEILRNFETHEKAIKTTL